MYDPIQTPLAVRTKSQIKDSKNNRTYSTRSICLEEYIVGLHCKLPELEVATVEQEKLHGRYLIKKNTMFSKDPVSSEVFKNT